MNSSLHHDNQRQNQTKNPSTNFSYNVISLVTRYKLTSTIVLLLVILLISIAIFLVVFKCKRKDKGRLQRNNHVIKRRVQLKPDPSDGSHATLLDHADRKTFRDKLILLTDHTSSFVLSDPDLGHKLRSASTGTPRGSQLSVPSRQLSVTYAVSRNHENDDISDLDLEIISLHRQISLDDVPSKPEVTEPPNNPYLAHYEEQAKEQLKSRKAGLNSAEVSDDSTSSEPSCV